MLSLVFLMQAVAVSAGGLEVPAQAESAEAKTANNADSSAQIVAEQPPCVNNTTPPFADTPAAHAQACIAAAALQKAQEHQTAPAAKTVGKPETVPAGEQAAPL
jgi:hypothetical protein